jgi:hypothetical protein
VNIKNINETAALHAMKIFPLFLVRSSLVFFTGLLLCAHANTEADADIDPVLSAPTKETKDAAPLRQFHAQYSVFTHHFFPSPEHVNRNHLINLEYMFAEYPEIGRWTRFGADRALIGGAVFKNSFGQPTQYLYVGQQWDVNKNVYIKLTAGLLHGYKDQYQNKIPFNHYGTAPVILPMIGFSLGRATIETILLSNRAAVIAIGVAF